MLYINIYFNIPNNFNQIHIKHKKFYLYIYKLLNQFNKGLYEF